MRARFAGGVVAAVLLGTTLPASASPQLRPALRGTITMSGSTSFVRELVLTRPVRFDASHRVVRTNGGRYSGFVLRKVVRGDAAPTVASVAPGYCVTRGCRRPAWSGTYVADLFTGFTLPVGQSPDHAPLTPGRYRLYLVADGAPVTVTLRFPGSGRTSFTGGTRVATPVDVPEAATWEPDAGAGSTGSLYSAGSTRRTRAPFTFHFMTSWKYVYGPPRAANQQGVCDYDGKPPEGHLGRYQYPCGGPAGFFLFGQRPTGRTAGPGGAADEFAATTEYFGVTAVTAERSVGGYINGPSPATAAHTTVLWVDLP